MHNPVSTTALLRRAVSLARSDEIVFAAYQRMRRNASALMRPVSIDLTSKCNLFCEGCYYYEGDSLIPKDETDLAKWTALFRRKAQEGTKFAYIAGAEPAIYPERLRPRLHDVENLASLKRWLEICDYWAWFYLGSEYVPKI